MRPAQIPVLTRVTELRPPWEEHLRYVPHRVRNGYISEDKWLRHHRITLGSHITDGGQDTLI